MSSRQLRRAAFSSLRTRMQMPELRSEVKATLGWIRLLIVGFYPFEDSIGDGPDEVNDAEAPRLDRFRFV